jgi:hypothetical protein
MKNMKNIKKQLAVAVTVALLAFPLSSTLAMADEAIPTVITTVPATTTTDTTVPATTALQVEAAAIATAKTTLAAPVVDANGDTVAPANWFTDLIEKLQLALTFDPARKAELNERHALAKLAEAQKLMQDGKPEAAQICLNQYTDKITKAQAFLDQVKDPTSEAAKTLTSALANVDSNNIQVLSNLIDKLPPQAAQKLALNVVRSMEKAVEKIQKEEAKVAIETTPATTPVITPVVDRKILEKQAKVALENFKKSLNQKGKIHIEDQDQEDDEDKNVVEQSKPEQEKTEVEQNSHQVTQTQSITQSQPTHVTVAPVKTQTAPTFRTSENNKDDRNKQEDRKKDNGGDNRRDH